jgi:subtilase family protein
MERPTENLTEPLPSETASKRVGGCLTGAVAAVALTCAGGMGLVWLGTLLGSPTGPKDIAFDAGRTVVFSVLGLAPFALAAIFVRSPRYGLWRGVALAVAMASGAAVLNGITQTIDHALPYPGVPESLHRSLPLVYGLIWIGIARKRLLARPSVPLVMLAFALGLVISASWFWVGAVGDMVEIWIGLLDALGIAVIHGLAAAPTFWYDEEFLTEHPVWSAILVGGTLTAVSLIVTASRGYLMQGLVMVVGFSLTGVAAGALFIMAEKPQPARQWWVVLALYLVVYGIAFQFGEGFEGDYMMENTGSAWLPTMPIGLITALVTGSLLLILRRVLIRTTEKVALPAAMALTSIVLAAGIWVAFGKPQVQATSFYVIMKDQADTSSARQIKNYHERAQTVYDMLTQHADETQADLRKLLVERGASYTPTYLVNGIEVYGDPLLRAQIAGRADVERILDSPVYRPLPAFANQITLPAQSDSIAGEDIWGIKAIHADKVQQELHIEGTGIVLGSADSGVEWSHPALRENFAGSAGHFDYVWFDPWAISTEPTDSIGHGTHTTGIMVGQMGIGVAPGAKWIACRSLVHSLGNPPGYIACMQFLFAPFPQDGDPLHDGDPSRGAQIVNSSLGCPIMEGCDDTVLPMALDQLANAGQMNVVAAGNDGPTCSTVDSFAASESIITVGAIGPDGLITDFSSRGPIREDGLIKPDVAAPGESVWSAVPNGYSAFPGTSMAAPHVAGVVALMWSANPALIGDIETTKRIIEDTAHYMTAPDVCGDNNGKENNVYGYGVVDAYAAVTQALEIAQK